MNYFEILGVTFGSVAMLKPFYMHILPWDENKYIGKAYSEKRPGWIVSVAVFGLILVAYTWYKELTTDVPRSMVMTILFSLTAIKAGMLLFDYKKFQQWIAGMLMKDKGREIVLVDVLAGLFGLLIVVSAIIFY